MKRSFIIGDVHGHYGRLNALLKKAELITNDGERTDDTEIIQVGDLCHFGVSGDHDGDRKCVYAAKQILDTWLYGNHDIAAIFGYHKFSGFTPPDQEIINKMKAYEDEQFLKFAVHRHGYLITHAGLSPHYFSAATTPTKRLNKDMSLDEIVDRLNSAACREPYINDIGRSRGGRDAVGGILWRDDRRDKLYEGIKQIYGHTARGTEDFPHKNGDSYCIDIGTAHNGRLGGVFLPDLEFVETNSVV